MFHAADSERIEYLRTSGFPFIVMIDTDLTRDEFDDVVEPVTSGPWTKAIEIRSTGSRFRVMAAFQKQADALMARMVVDK